jgi:putative nucleotidyltransferase with HDIG domain
MLQREEWFHKQPFSVLAEQKNTEQSPVHHPEGNVWNHTLLVVDEAAKRKSYSSDARAFMWAALLHDIGKPAATKIRKGKITAYDHDKLGADIARGFLLEYTDNTDFIDRVARLVRYHMHILYVSKGLPFQDMTSLIRSTNANDIALLGFCDRLGRAGADIEKERETTLLFLKKCNEATDKPWLSNER